MAKENTSNTWLFLGPEIGEKDEAVKAIKQGISGPAGSGLAGGGLSNIELEEHVYYGGETAMSQVVSEMQNGALFSDRRLFFIKAAEGIKKKEDQTLLASYIASPSDDTYLILLSEESSISKVIENKIPSTHRRVFWELLDSRKTQWVSSFFQNAGYRIGGEAIETILELVENNTAALKQECSRLLLFCKDSKEISAADAEKWLSHTREENPFILFSRIASGDLERSLESLRILLAAKESPPAIFAALASCFRKLLSYLALKEGGVRDDGEYRKIGVSAPGAKRDYAAAAARYNTAAAETCLALTTEYDFLVRSRSSFPEHIVLDSYVLKLFAAARS
ncbi:MAG: DNA polymerase III subunit delta [Treponema sp.]|nr:DNA polymerase III subunit delta [Treponema sp.]